jgi:hypothetical protein
MRSMVKCCSRWVGLKQNLPKDSKSKRELVYASIHIIVITYTKYFNSTEHGSQAILEYQHLLTSELKANVVSVHVYVSWAPLNAYNFTIVFVFSAISLLSALFSLRDLLLTPIGLEELFVSCSCMAHQLRRQFHWMIWASVSLASR